jgi:hypothetical protein
MTFFQTCTVHAFGHSMKFIIRCVFVAIAWLVGISGAGRADDRMAEAVRPIAQGGVAGRPFWNGHARRFIYPPAFDFAEVAGAARYRFTLECADGRSRELQAERPTAALSPVWLRLPEGRTMVRVEGLDGSGKVVGEAGKRDFYRSPAFSGVAEEPVRPYAEAARDGLGAIFAAPHVQHWLVDGKPDRTYERYCYPNKVMGGLVRAMAAYSRVAEKEEDRKTAIEIGRRVADHLLTLQFAAETPYANVPPTYSIDVDKPGPAKSRFAKHWLMVPSAMDAGFAFLDLYNVTKDEKYLAAAKAIADTFVQRQEADGTWPLVVNWQTGEADDPQRLVPTWVIIFFDRLERQYQLADYRASRQRAWRWIEEHPLKTYQWDGQFEDVLPRKPYVNLAREQACDVAVLLMSEPQASSERIAQAEELLRFAEDQFVVWSPVRDPAGWNGIGERKKDAAAQNWITPCVLEQYACYLPVARSSAVLINAYLKAYAVTKREVYLAKAKTLANGLIKGQAWLAEKHDGKGEIPTWLKTDKVLNWLNNSFYAAEAVERVADVVGKQ